jgi:hypothetical protein
LIEKTELCEKQEKILKSLKSELRCCYNEARIAAEAKVDALQMQIDETSTDVDKEALLEKLEAQMLALKTERDSLLKSKARKFLK